MAAALALFTESAYASTSVPQIASRAGVAAGTIYRYFPSKEALANAIYRQEKTAMRDALSAALTVGPENPGAEHETRMCWAALLGLLHDHRAGVLFLEGQQHAAYLTDESRSVGTEVDSIAFEVIRRGQRDGTIKPGDPAIFTAMLFGAFVGLAKVTASPTDDLVSSTASAAWHLISSEGHS
jgi:AcrR family transcriptional regulator